MPVNVQHARGLLLNQYHFTPLFQFIVATLLRHSSYLWLRRERVDRFSLRQRSRCFNAQTIATLFSGGTIPLSSILRCGCVQRSNVGAFGRGICLGDARAVVRVN